jgi:hypothetical protein
MIAVSPTILAIFSIALVFCDVHFSGFRASQQRAIACPAAFAVSEVALMESNVYVSDLTWSQFGAVAHVITTLTVGEGAAALYNAPCLHLGWSQS